MSHKLHGIAAACNAMYRQIVTKHVVTSPAPPCFGGKVPLALKFVKGSLQDNGHEQQTVRWPVQYLDNFLKRPSCRAVVPQPISILLTHWPASHPKTTTLTPDVTCPPSPRPPAPFTSPAVPQASSSSSSSSSLRCTGMAVPTVPSSSVPLSPCS